jgi:hypothetical protein
MNILKKNQYVILLLIVIIFVSLSFFVILNMPFREGFEDDPYNDPTYDMARDMEADIETDDRDIEEIPLQKKDAQNIHNKCIVPFMKNIDGLMITSYKYKIIYDILEDSQKKKKRKNPDQTQLNAYFKDPSSITIQDIMDKLSDNVSLIRENPIFKINKKGPIALNYIVQYKNSREIPSSDIKQRYIDCISCIENELKMIATRTENYYEDTTLNDLIKREKMNPLCYGLNSTFHKLRLYVKAGIENKLNTDENSGL